ncbi:glycosyltransferase family 4 protein [Enterovibrio norvegicus]|uniref:glycosyltransferase family 4 protein n=1 Tax=Enterovibrio norvegicus TaxID=188144 RepID=UPI000C83CCE1|nr:glycosyltransferase family 4 protein [Enterovibrio norvegicus]PMH72482.1 glycosyltransferase WbuB [Enterovibrio norvegicus]
MKVLIMTQWFDPEPTIKGLLFAKELQKKGHKVEVVTGFPNYPGGRIYSGYKLSAYKKEIKDGVTIHRLPLYPSHDGSAIKRVLNYTSFAVSSFLGGLFLTKDIDVIYSYHPPLTTSLSSVLLGLFKRVPVVIDIQDLWPDTLAATGMVSHKKVLSVVGSFCKFTYRRATKIAVLSPGFKAKLIERGVPAEKIEVIYNWCNERALENFEPCDVSLPDNGNINVVFAGNLGFAQGLPSIIEAAEILQSRDSSANVVLIGDGADKSKAMEMAASKKLKNTFFLPRVPMEQIGGLLSASDALLVHLKKDDLFKITIPSRTQANLAMGKPIIMAVEGDASELVSRSKGGITVEPDNPLEIASAIETIASLSPHERECMGRAAAEFYYKELSLSQGVDKFSSLFRSLV